MQRHRCVEFLAGLLTSKAQQIWLVQVRLLITGLSIDGLVQLLESIGTEDPQKMVKKHGMPQQNRDWPLALRKLKGILGVESALCGFLGWRSP